MASASPRTASTSRSSLKNTGKYFGPSRVTSCAAMLKARSSRTRSPDTISHLEVERGQLAGKCLVSHPRRLRGLGLVPPGAIQYPADIFPFKIAQHMGQGAPGHIKGYGLRPGALYGLVGHVLLPRRVCVFCSPHSCAGQH
ncbi:hypothetical protein vBDshSR4C_033 [Dinoroseobacter phage vB_DshS-R4C]|nr:hypothetical protein vBDshSR4C_033 [Dinoroseobacter phage vB_DshS-R4C]